MRPTPKMIVGGTQHNAASSFKDKNLQAFEGMKSYRNQKTLWVCPSRGMMPTAVAVSLLALQWPMNHFRTNMMCVVGMEVAAAYNELFGLTFDRKRLVDGFGKEYGDAMMEAPFILTTEEDNVIPNDAVLKLMEAIYTCPDCGGEVGSDDWRCDGGHRGFDAVSGLYFIKSFPPIPMAFGYPGKSRTKFDFRPVSVKAAVKAGKVIEVNGIAMGCALWRKDLFKRVKQPWFKTLPEGTQDLYFCKNAKIQAKARFGVHCGVRVAHLNTSTGEFF